VNILAIDAGNTRLKWGYARDREWIRVSALATRDVERLGVALSGLPPPQRIVVSNVAGPTVADAIAAALTPLGTVPRWIRSGAQQCGVRSSYSDPAQLGPDRWAALIGAWQGYGGPSIVANAGTTLTVDALTADGVFLGGCIVPGIELMRAALADNTARLTRAEGVYTYFPDRTADAITSGIINALAGSIERMVAFMAQTGEPDARIVLSGGDARALVPQLNGPVEVVDNLVLEGLACIALEAG
jgi:type III pantothenate kinase